MKKVNKITGLVVLIAIAGLLCAACGDGGGGGVAANVRAYNNNGISPAQANQRSVMNRAPRAVHPSFNAYTAFYGKLGAHKSDITPSKFNLAATIMAIDSNGYSAELGTGLFNFAEGISVNIGEVPAGYTCAAINLIMTAHGLGLGNGDIVHSSVEFEWPGGKSVFDSHALTPPFYGYDFGDSGGFTPSWDGDKGTLQLVFFMQDFVEEHVLNVPSETQTIGEFSGVFYGAGERELMKTAFPISRIVPGASNNWTLSNEGAENLIVPFTPVTISDSASSVTLNISWNLENLISQYEGATSSPDDDIFVLKENWWDGLYLYASVN